MLSSLENVASKSFKLHPSNNTLGTKININAITFYDICIYNYIFYLPTTVLRLSVYMLSYVELYSKSKRTKICLHKKEKGNLQIIS